jgi:SAM-dependent methyltransferase
MRKDYVPVTDAAATEDAFVEQYWTDKWRDRTVAPDVSRVTAREEFALMAPVVERLPPGSRLLDGGCGTGEWTVYFTQRGFAVTGIDISTATVERLQHWFPDQHFVAGDLRHTAFADASFDAYFSWGTFEHFESGLGDCIAEARRIVRPGGWLFVSVPFHNGRLQRTPPLVAEPGHRFYQWRLTKTELRDQLERGGFRVHRITAIAKDTGASRWLRSRAPGLPPASLAFRASRRLLTTLVPASFLAHMILAVGERR